MLRYYENLSSKQIGELLGVAPTAVDMRLLRARRQLRDQLTAAAADEVGEDVSGVEENGVALGDEDGGRQFASVRRRNGRAGRIV
jgi:predicted transcriptional regulator